MAYFTDHALADIAACVLQTLTEFEQGKALANRVDLIGARDLQSIKPSEP